MDGLVDLGAVPAWVEAAWGWLVATALDPAKAGELAAVLAAFLAARMLAPRAQGWIEAGLVRVRVAARLPLLAQALTPLTLPLIWLALVLLPLAVYVEWGLAYPLLRAAASLLTAWIVIRLTAALVREPTWSRLVALVAWTVAALNIVGLLSPTVAFLDGIAFTLGELRISALGLLKGVVSFAVLLWAALFASRVAERRLAGLTSLTPSARVLFGKLLKITLVTLAVLVAVSGVGIDLTALALFSGAVGLGIGFGLQKVVSNLISGVILLLDKSVKPGDVIGVGEQYGWINSLGARYVSVITRDGTEHLIPNEDLITQRVENWSYTNNLVRLKIPIGVSYKADVRKAIGLALEAAAETARVLAEPKPACLLKGFGESSVDLELRIWIEDPQAGIANVKSEVLLGVWDKFHMHGIEIPFPQRDVHIRPPAELKVLAEALAKGATEAAPARPKPLRTAGE